MTWTPSKADRRAAQVVAEILRTQNACGVPASNDLATNILAQYNMLNIVAEAISHAVLDEIKAENRRAAGNGQLPPGVIMGADGLLWAEKPYSMTAEYQAKLDEIRKAPQEAKDSLARWPERYTPSKIEGDRDYPAEQQQTWTWPPAKRPGSDVNNAADIAAYQEENGEAELARRARAAGPDMTARCIIPLSAGPAGTVIFHYGRPYIIAADGKAYPPAKDNLREQAPTSGAVHATTLESLEKEGFAHTITMTDTPKPGGIIDTHVGTAWGEGPQAGLMADEPLGNATGASLGGETALPKPQVAKKRPGRPKGSYGKKKKEAMRKAKAAERAAAKAAKEAADSLNPTSPPPKTAAEVGTFEVSGTIEVPEHEVDPDTVDVHAHLGSET